MHSLAVLRVSAAPNLLRNSFISTNSVFSNDKNAQKIIKAVWQQMFSCSAATAAVNVEQQFKPSTSKREQYNIGTIGHIDHGKTTLTAAITKILAEHGNAKYMSFEDIDRAPEEKRRGITMNIAHISYQTPKRHYSHTDCPGHKDFIKNMICGASQMDAAILVIAATDGVMPQTREHIMLAKRVGIENIIVFINKTDKADEDMLELVEIETRELLIEFGFDGANTQFIKGSALCALEGVQPNIGREAVLNLVQQLDKLPAPERNFEGTFYMPIQSLVSVTGRGTVAIGTVERGALKKGDAVELVGFGKNVKTTASDLQVFNKPIPEIKAGDHCGVLCRGLKKGEVRRGHWLAAPGSILMRNVLRAESYLLTKEEGGREIPLRSGFTQKLRCTTWEQTVRVILQPDMDMMLPGDHATAYFVLLKPMPIEKGMPFTISENAKDTVMSGIVSDILSDIDIADVENFKNVKVSIGGDVFLDKEQKKK